MRYLGDNSPATIGVNAGVSELTNTTAYVGFGMWGDRRLPGRVQIVTSGTRTPGSYVPWAGDQKVGIGFEILA
jgi:hypothetical protein